MFFAKIVYTTVGQIKTIKIYSGNTAKYIVINRVGRIRIINSYEDSS